MGAGLEGAKSASKAISGIRLAQDGAEPEGWCRYGIVEPEEGMLILFPSWLPHCVMPFVAPEEDPGAARISIAFNVGMQQDGVR